MKNLEEYNTSANHTPSMRYCSFFPVVNKVFEIMSLTFMVQ